MSRRFFKRLLPCRNRLAKEKFFMGRFSRLLAQPNYWHLNRNSTARGIASGAFWAFIPIPGQTILAILTAIRIRGNIGLAIVLTWLSNPFTMFFCFYAAYRLGLLAMFRSPKENFFENLTQAFKLPWADFFAWCSSNLDVLIPFLIGSVILSTLSAIIFYVLSHAFWRLLLTLKIRRRATRLRAALATA